MKQNKKQKDSEYNFNKKLGELCPIFLKKYLEENGEKEFYKKYYKLTKFLPKEFKYIFDKNIKNG